METNESIKGREVVAIKDRKRVGKVERACVNADTLAVSGLLVRSATTAASLVVPFESVVGIGDAFATISSRDEMMKTDSSQARDSYAEGYQLVNIDAFTRRGNALGRVDSFTFDSESGKILEIFLDNGAKFGGEDIVFFAPDMVFFEDPVASVPSETVGRAVELFPEAVVVEEAPAPAEPEVDDNADIKAFLLGKTLNEAVTSEDASFSAAQGSELTAEVIEAAARADALMILTLSVD